MKVLILTDFFLSGQTTHVLELAKQLKALEVEPHLAFGTIHTKLFWSDYIPYLEQYNISFSLNNDLSKLFALCRLWHPDLIHAQSSTLFQKTQVLASRLKIPYVLTCHGLGFNRPRYRHVLSSADAIIAIGPNVARELQELSHKVEVIFNGVDTELFCPPSNTTEPRRDVLYLGRLERKRIEPLRNLVQAHGAITAKPLKIISNWNPGLRGTIFYPWQTNVIPHLQASGIVVACGRTAREALSCGNVVLLMQQAYDGVITPQLVKRSDFDFSGNLGRYPLTDIRYDLHALLQRPHRLKKLQRWGRNYALDHLSSKEMAEKTIALYKKVLDKKSPK